MHSILLVGAALVGLPIVLHLIMKQEPKRLPFPAFRFLKERRKTNQRKLRLRHFVLLALRMLLIALFCLTLYQPTLLSEGLNIRGEQPVAVVFVVDTTPSMGYTANDRTRLEEARRRALELLGELPTGSRVAVLETGDPTGGDWLPSEADARRRLEAIAEPRGVAAPVSDSLNAAYRLLADGPETDTGEKMQRLVAVFTDRGAGSWDAARNDDLKKLRDSLPEPKPLHVVADVGVDKPANVAIVSAEIRPQVVPGGRPAVVTVTVAAVGPDVDAVVKANVVNGPSERKPVKVPGGQSRAVTFEFRDLKPGPHACAFSLEAADALAFDNTRYLTFRVGEARKILTVSDDPDDAALWKLAHESVGEFACDVVTPGQLATTDLAGYEVVCLLNVARPNETVGGKTVWERVREYVHDGGGKLIVMPGGEELSRDDYDPGGPTAPGKVEAANVLMPGRLKDVFDCATLPEPKPADAPGPDRRYGVPWFLDDATIQRSAMLAPFKEWRRAGNIGFIKNPRRAKRFWEVEPVANADVIVSYDTGDKPAGRKPAVLERAVGKGKVVLLTTRMDVPPADRSRQWNDYWELAGTAWEVVFPNLLVKYLAGDTADANFNFVTGRSVPVALPRGGLGKVTTLILEHPKITEKDDVYVKLPDRATDVRLGPPRTNHAGNFTLFTEDKKWSEAFSLNVPAEESVLDKVPEAVIEDVTGKGTVIPLDKNLKLRDVIEGRFTQPVDLFPWLLIAVLLLLAVEGLVANRFYRPRR